MEVRDIQRDIYIVCDCGDDEFITIDKWQKDDGQRVFRLKCKACGITFEFVTRGFING